MARAVTRRLSIPPTVSQIDAEQEAMRRLLEKKKDPKFQKPNWLFQRVWGDMKDLYGREWKRHYGQTPEPDASRRPDQPDQNVVMDVQDAVARLSPGHRRVVELIAYRGLSHAEAAAELGLSTAATTMRYARARMKLAEMLEAYAHS